MSRRRPGGLQLPPLLTPYTIPDGIDNFMLPEMPYAGAASGVQTVGPDWVGAYFLVQRPLSFNRLVYRINGVTIAGNLVMGLYQAPDGLSSNPINLVQRYTESITVLGVFEAVGALNGGLTVLQPGLCALIWASTDGADYAMTTYNNSAIALGNNALPDDYRPLVFDANVPISPAADPPPASLDARHNRDVLASANDFMMVWRTRRV